MSILGFFILSKKRELKISLLLEIFLWMMICLEVMIFTGMTNSSRMKTLKKSFLDSSAIFSYLNTKYWNSWASLFLSVNISNLFDRNIILTCFEYFLGYLHLILFGVNGANIGRAYTRGTYASSIYAKDICIRRTYIRSTYIGSIYIGDIYIGSACINSICISNTCIRYIRDGNLLF